MKSRRHFKAEDQQSAILKARLKKMAKSKGGTIVWVKYFELRKRRYKTKRKMTWRMKFGLFCRRKGE